ncbi:hypothetical protein BDZ91DRAFT_57755 [Kalaharituber pfeilii]|nr:hypothetical protein BDZ91DRAFT_57755 [Kalaharituber pfeilii]
MQVVWLQCRRRQNLPKAEARGGPVGGGVGWGGGRSHAWQQLYLEQHPQLAPQAVPIPSSFVSQTLSGPALAWSLDKTIPRTIPLPAPLLKFSSPSQLAPSSVRLCSPFSAPEGVRCGGACGLPLNPETKGSSCVTACPQRLRKAVLLSFTQHAYNCQPSPFYLA